MNLIWSALAKQDLLNITGYLIKRSPKGGRSVLGAIGRAAATLPDFPHMGKETGPADRWELVIPHTSYVLVYQTSAEQIEIIRVFHGTQNRPPV